MNPFPASSLVRAALLASGLLLGATVGRALTVSPTTTDGPYYPFNSTQRLDTTWLVGADNDLTLVSGRTSRASGTRFLLSGTLVNTAGTAIAGATIELWQTDNNGIYYHSGNSYQNRDQNFQSYGTCTTDSAGAWSFRTVKPGLYTGRIRHFHYKVSLNGTTLLISQFMFEEDRSSFTSDGVASPLVSAGTINLAVLSPTTGIDSVDNTSALLASKEVVVNVTTSASSSTGTSGTTTTSTPVTTTTATTSTTASTTSSGGGGGAPSAWFVGLLATLAGWRLRRTRDRDTLDR